MVWLKYRIKLYLSSNLTLLIKYEQFVINSRPEKRHKEGTCTHLITILRVFIHHTDLYRACHIGCRFNWKCEGFIPTRSFTRTLMSFCFLWRLSLYLNDGVRIHVKHVSVINKNSINYCYRKCTRGKNRMWFRHIRQLHLHWDRAGRFILILQILLFCGTFVSVNQLRNRYNSCLSYMIIRSEIFLEDRHLQSVKFLYCTSLPSIVDVEFPIPNGSLVTRPVRRPAELFGDASPGKIYESEGIHFIEHVCIVGDVSSDELDRKFIGTLPGRHSLLIHQFNLKY